MWLVHLVPLFGMAVNFLITDIIFLRKHLKQLVIFAFFYLGINYYATMKRGMPVYHFMRWETPFDFLIALFIVFCAVILFSAYVSLSECLKNRTIKRIIVVKEKAN